MSIQLKVNSSKGFFQAVYQGLQICEHRFHSDELHHILETEECDEQGVSRPSQRSPVDVGSISITNSFQSKFCIGEDHFCEVNSGDDESSERGAFGLAG
jgi:hypothetical protein